MSVTGPGGRRHEDVVDDHPLRGGLTGIALVALATLGVSMVAAVIVLIALLIAG